MKNIYKQLRPNLHPNKHKLLKIRRTQLHTNQLKQWVFHIISQQQTLWLNHKYQHSTHLGPPTYTIVYPLHTLFANILPLPSNPTPRIFNPILKENLKTLSTQFFENNSIQLNKLIQLLKTNNQLTPYQWQTTCTSLETPISNISTSFQNTCNAPPTSTSQNMITNQKDYLPKSSKKHRKTSCNLSSRPGTIHN